MTDFIQWVSAWGILAVGGLGLLIIWEELEQREQRIRDALRKAREHDERIGAVRASQREVRSEWTKAKEWEQ